MIYCGACLIAGLVIGYFYAQANAGSAIKEQPGAVRGMATTHPAFSNAAGSSGTNAALQRALEFWISTNTTAEFLTKGAGGTGGTLDRPLDGSSQTNFDHIMADMPSFSTIHILAGTYQTLGELDWGPKTGQRIIGSGIGITVLQFPASAVASGEVNRLRIINPSPPYFQTNIEVSDMTLDCNYQPGSMITLNGIDLHGSGNAIRRVKVINAASFTSGITNYTEAWGITMESFPYGEASENIIEGCEVSQFTNNNGNNLSAICLLENNSGIIRDNRVIGNPPNLVFALAPGSHNSLVEGNYVVGAYSASHTDDGTGNTNIIFAHNRFVNCGSAIDWSNGHVENVTFAFNDIILTNSPYFPRNNGSSTAFNFQPSPATFKNVAIIGNTVSFTGLTNVPKLEFIDAHNITGLIVEKNTVDARLTNSFANCLNIRMDNNHDLP